MTASRLAEILLVLAALVGLLGTSYNRILTTKFADIQRPMFLDVYKSGPIAIGLLCVIGFIFELAATAGHGADDAAAWVVVALAATALVAAGGLTYATPPPKRRLLPAEYRAIGQAMGALRARDGDSRALAMLHLLFVTGWEVADLLALRWSDIAATHYVAHLGGAIRGPGVRTLSPESIAIMHARAGQDPEYVFGPEPRRAEAELQRIWQEVLERAQVPGQPSLVVLRQSFIYLAMDIKVSPALIGRLVGERRSTLMVRIGRKPEDDIMYNAARLAGMVNGRLGLK